MRNRITFITGLLLFFNITFLHAQLPWTEDFSNNAGEGIRGKCNNASPGSCNTYNPSSEWTLSGNCSQLKNLNDYFYVAFVSGKYRLTARDIRTELCYTSSTINLPGSTNIDMEVDLSESNLSGSDYFKVYIIIDGAPVLVQTVSGDFNSTTVGAYGIPASTSVAVQICVFNNHNNDRSYIDEIRLEEACNPPVASCQDITVSLTDGTATINADDIDNGSTADCGIDSRSIDISAFDCDDIGTNTVTLTVEDNSGQQSTCEATVTVTYTPSPPVASCKDITVGLGCENSVSITAEDIDNGSTYDCGLSEMALSQTTFLAPGTYSVTLTVEDNLSQTDECEATVTVTGAGGSAPVFNSCPDDATQSNNPGECSAIVNYTTPSVPDITVNGFSENYSECFWDIYEPGNSSVDFSNAPDELVLVSNNGSILQTGGYVEMTVTCQLTISFDWFYDSDGSGLNGLEPFFYSLNGSTTSLTGFLGSGNESGSFSIDLDAGDTFGFGLFSTLGIGGHEIVDITNFVVVEYPEVFLTTGLPSGSAFPIGTTTVEYTAYSCGGNSTCSFDVTIEDTETPDISCPPIIINQSVDPGECFATVNDIGPDADDNCSSTVSYTLAGATTGSGNGDASGTQFNAGVTIVNYTISDPSLNTNSCLFLVNIAEDEPPSVTCQDITISLTSASVEITPEDVYASSDDNCTSVSLVSVSPNTFSCDDLGLNVVTLTVSDASGNTNTCTANVTIQNMLEADIFATDTELSCSKPIIVLSAVGSTSQGSKSYLWTGGFTNSAIIAVSPGTYTVTVTDNANGCTDTESIYISQNSTSPEADIDASNSELNCNITSVNLDASASVTQGSKSYLWTGGATTSEININAPGTYFVTITDGDNGCTDVASVAISQDVLAPEAEIEASNSELNCNVTSVNLDAGGSTTQGSASYLWTGGATTSEININAPGTYFVTITDGDNGCTDVASVAISQDIANPEAEIDASDSELSCQVGSIILDATGSIAQGVVDYMWSGGVSDPELIIDATGTYSVTITDNANGCTDVASINIQQDITTPSAVIIPSDLHFNCHVSSIVLDATSSTTMGATSYLWTGGSTNSTINISEPGTYSVTITDEDNGCDDVANIVMSAIESVSITETHSDVSCYGSEDGTIDITASGGNGNLNYEWNDGITTEDRSALGPGSYTVTVTDESLCTASKAISIVEPEILEVSTSGQTAASCYGNNDGVIELIVQGGTPVYSFHWNDDALDGTQNPSGLAAGSYQVTVTDANECTATASAAIGQPAELDVKDHEHETCVYDAENINLDNFNGDVTTESGFIVWYYDAGLTDAIASSPPVVSVSDGQSMYCELTEMLTGCKKNAKVTFEVDIEFCPLSEELRYFKGSETNCNYILTWATIQEENLSHFEIERSTDGSSFEKIGEITANDSNRYNFTDDSGAENRYYFRLKVVDPEGFYEYSDIIYLESKCFAFPKMFDLYPNPVNSNNLLTLKVETPDASPGTKITVYDVLGNSVSSEVHDLEKGENIIQLKVNHLKSGKYFVQLQNVRSSVSLTFLLIQD